jgi:t-SNARE complex subunit (syntaxin)
MSEENKDQVEDNVVPIVKTRTKSPETLLKAEMKTIKKELDGLVKTAADLEALTKEVASNVARKTKLEADLDKVKGKLLKALGLD